MTENLATRIESLFQQNRYITIRGIAQKLEIKDENEVKTSIDEYPNIFRESYIKTKDGRPLYTLRSRKISVRERFVHFLETISSLYGN